MFQHYRSKLTLAVHRVQDYSRVKIPYNTILNPSVFLSVSDGYLHDEAAVLALIPFIASLLLGPMSRNVSLVWN
jgi:hypothetical protein